jgi:glycerophosphoryl diester phosphodiesterase
MSSSPNNSSYSWIHPSTGTVQPLPSSIKNALVMHRGYHSSLDYVTRPLENTVQAYEMAWALGAKYAECDVTLTRDQVIVLCHDDTYERLALNKQLPNATKKVNELSLADVQSLVLINGTVPSTLEQVLIAASLLDGRLIIEIKGDDLACARAVAEFMMKKRPDLAKYVGVVMGFSQITVYEFARCMPQRGETLVMLLTVCEERKASDNWDGPTLDLQDTSKLEVLLTSPQDGVKIDGLYVELQSEFMPLLPTTFVNMIKKIPVGIWGRSRLDTDQVDLWEPLVEAGVRFVNTDMPDTFFKRNKGKSLPHPRLDGGKGNASSKKKNNTSSNNNNNSSSSNSNRQSKRMKKE